MRLSTPLTLAATLLAGTSAAGSSPAAPPAPLAITHVTIIDPEGGPPQSDMTVLVRDGRIARVERTGAAIPAAIRVDGRGKFLIPGLWDAHVHLSSATASALPVLVANGITMVRDCGSDLAEIDDWRSKIAAGLLTGPQIVRAGPILNGKSFNRYQIETRDPEQARGIVRSLKWMGVDFIKIHRRVPRDAYLAIIDEARLQGLEVAGHIPMTVRPDEASDAGQLIEHEETLFEGTFSESLTAAQLPAAIERFLSSGAADSLFARFVRNRTPVTSTLTTWRYLVEHPDTTWLRDPRIRYVARSNRDAARRAPPMSADDFAAIQRTVVEYGKVLAALNRAGVTLLAGTDLGGARIPGFSLHDELATLVEAGLTPIQALQAATSTPSRVLGREADSGSVTPGKRADLILLDADPLADIHNTQRIAAVVLGGKLLRRSDLDRLLRSAEDIASRN